MFIAIRPFDADACNRWLSGGAQDLCKSAVEQLLLEQFNSFLTVDGEPLVMERLKQWDQASVIRQTSRHSPTAS